MENKNILLIGTYPPPIGGVSIYNYRLLDHLKRNRYKVNFYDIKKINFIYFFINIIKSDLIHVSITNVYVIVSVLFIALFFKKKTIVTFHRNLGRYNCIKNRIDLLSVKIADIPLVLNASSYKKCISINPNTMLTSAFIYPNKNEFTKGELYNKIKDISLGYNKVICMNASNVKFENGRDVYGVVDVCDGNYFNDDILLIISDPSSGYSNMYKNNLKKDNVKFISHKHSFMEVLLASDYFLRPTTTDGDSLSIKEALFLNVPVIASDCVDRPKGCTVYPTDSLYEVSKIINNKRDTYINIDTPHNGYLDVEAAYKELLRF